MLQIVQELADTFTLLPAPPAALAHLASSPAAANMEPVTGWAVKGTGGETLWLTAGDTKATVTAFASRGASLGLSPRRREVHRVATGRDGAFNSCWELTLGPMHAGFTFCVEQTNKSRAMKSRILVMGYYGFLVLGIIRWPLSPTAILKWTIDSNKKTTLHKGGFALNQTHWELMPPTTETPLQFYQSLRTVLFLSPNFGKRPTSQGNETLKTMSLPFKHPE